MPSRPRAPEILVLSLTAPFPSRRLQALPLPLRIAGAAALPAAAFLLAWLLPDGPSAGYLPPLLLVAVLLAALGLGLTAGLAGAAAGFGLMLWRGATVTPDGSWSLALGVVFESFAWFAAAKLAVALVAVPRIRNRRLAAAAALAGEEARRKDLLLAEWSHRVSNDLYFQVSMLRTQAGAEPDAAPALRAAAGRVQVLGRVHGRLSRGAAAGAPVDSRAFLEGLVTDLRAAMAGGGQPVTLTLVAESHPLSLTAACDLGLVLNELVTNALKHAFPESRAGTVRMNFRRRDDSFELVVADDGIGGVPAGRGGGRGSRLLRGLAMQLGGRLDLANGEVGGTVCVLRFPVSAPGSGQDADAAAQAMFAGAEAPAAPRPRERPAAGGRG